VLSKSLAALKRFISYNERLLAVFYNVSNCV